jgi:hypothetical protein
MVSGECPDTSSSDECGGRHFSIISVRNGTLSLSPIFPLQCLDAAEFPYVGGYQRQIMAQSLAGDQLVIGSNRLAGGFERGANTARNFGIL